MLSTGYDVMRLDGVVLTQIQASSHRILCTIPSLRLSLNNYAEQQIVSSLGTC